MNPRRTVVSPTSVMSRRRALAAVAGAGVGAGAFQRALAAAIAQQGQITTEMIQQAEWIAGIDLGEEERASTAQSLQRTVASFAKLREIELPNHVAPALHFLTPPYRSSGEPPRRDARPLESAAPQRPADEETLAFLPVAELAALLRTRQIASTELTRLYLERLKRFDPLLHCVVTLTEDLALQQAAAADREIAAGRYRGPLHGVPWGAKDLIAYPGFPTTWGAPTYRTQSLEMKATVAQRLEDAGAVMLGKLSLGALAQGDQWFGGQTRNPWNPSQGSSGSSAGSAAAVAAGLVGFALGSETLGSIVSPCRRCGATGLRPTFGRVSRYGCMALAWSMDKIGPITRSVQDTALILDAIHGSDGLDATAVDATFTWPSRRPLSSLTVGYVESSRRPTAEREELNVLRRLGVTLKPIELPSNLPVNDLLIILDVEAGASFDALTRAGVTEGLNTWPGTFRCAQFVPAVEYLRANRIRTLLAQAMEKIFRDVDLYVGGNDLVITNLTGHPSVVLPSGFTEREGRKTPLSLTMTGRLFGETELLQVAHAYQQATGAHLERPPLEDELKKMQLSADPPEGPADADQ